MTEPEQQITDGINELFLGLDGLIEYETNRISGRESNWTRDSARIEIAQGLQKMIEGFIIKVNNDKRD